MGYKFVPKQLLGSVYSIEELKDNFDDVKIGDEVNYEINGYSNWQVLYKDDYNGTVDVVSKTNTEDLTLEPNKDKDYYENKFQETANKYTDNSYAVKSRTVTQRDLEYFNYDNNFWLNNIDDTNITTSQSTWQYDQSDVEPNYKMYVIPYIIKSFDNASNYNVGDIIEYTNNGVDRWVVAANWGVLLLIPETPIELVIESVDDDISSKVNQITQSFNNGVSSVGNYVPNYGTNNLPNLIPNFLNQQTERIYFLSGPMYFKYGNKIKFMYNPIPYYENGEFGQLSSAYDREAASIIYTDTNPYTLGYRPVVTLKVKEEIQDKDKKEISNKLQVGDNVKYEAKGYKNWKVLRVDEDLGTVDIISGGIVKNITLSGKEDWDNFEDIIQNEVNQYKSGDKAKKATTVTSSHLKTLKQIDKSILSSYWILSKNAYIKETKQMVGNKTADLIFYIISTISLYKNDNYETYLDNIVIYAEYKGDQEAVDFYKNMYTGNINSSNYTAGLRPVITLKLSDAEKLSDKETKEVETSTLKQEKKYLEEQESKNKDYKGPKVVDDESSKGTKKDNNIIESNDNNESKIVEKIVYKDKSFYKYGFFTSIVIILIELGVIVYLVLKLKK